jgi:hypothetical protein
MLEKEIIEAQCQYCHYLHLGKCTYNNREDNPIFICNVFKEMVRRWTEYFIKISK